MKNLSTLGAGLALALFSMTGQATVVQGDYTVDLNDADPGLVLHYSDVGPDGFMWDLAVGEQETYDLFKIWTEEGTVNDGEDTEAKPISVNFSFLLPAVFDGSIDGTTEGRTFFGILQWGKLTWNGATELFFGPNGDGRLQIALSDEKFNEGVGGLWPFGATVQATVTLVRDATPVPAPGTLALFGAGMLGFAAVARRRRRHG